MSRITIDRGELVTYYQPYNLPGAEIPVRWQVYDEKGAPMGERDNYSGPGELLRAQDGKRRELRVGADNATRFAWYTVDDSQTPESDEYDRGYRAGFVRKQALQMKSMGGSPDYNDGMRDGFKAGKAARKAPKSNPRRPVRRNPPRMPKLIPTSMQEAEKWLSEADALDSAAAQVEAQAVGVEAARGMHAASPYHQQAFGQRARATALRAGARKVLPAGAPKRRAPAVPPKASPCPRCGFPERAPVAPLRGTQKRMFPTIGLFAQSNPRTCRCVRRKRNPSRYDKVKALAGMESPGQRASRAVDAARTEHARQSATVADVFVSLRPSDKVEIVFEPRSSSSPNDKRTVTVTHLSGGTLAGRYVYVTSGRVIPGNFSAGAIIDYGSGDFYYQPTMQQPIRRVISLQRIAPTPTSNPRHRKEHRP